MDSPFNVSRAERFARFARAAYCGSANIATWTCGPCIEADAGFIPKVITNDTEGTQAYVGMASDGSLVVAFRGSTNIPNWVGNIDIFKMDAYPKCHGCKVHTGFYHSWLSIKGPVISETTRLHNLHPEANIYVIGHSLGAALAAHAAAELGASYHSLGDPIAGVYTFGQPRVGNAAFANFYELGTHVSWRMTHHRDPVPHLPPEDFGFKHCGHEVFYNLDNSNHTVCDGGGEDPKCSDQYWAAIEPDNHNTYLKPPLSGDIDGC